METIQKRLIALREVMRQEHLGAFIVPSTDPHNGEYVPEHWKCREWLSGFNGSAGTVVVTADRAALWTDSRYFIAAAEQLNGTGIELMKERVAGTPTISQWIGAQLADTNSKEVGIDGMVASLATVEELKKELRKAGGLTLRTNLDPFAEVWKDRPPLPADKISVYPICYAGEPVKDKLQRTRHALRTLHADGMLVTALDEIAWLLNLRGTDVRCNPVFVSFLLISSVGATLFIDRDKLTAEVAAHLQECGVGTAPYQDVAKGLAAYFEYSILIDPASSNYTLARAVKCHEIVYAPSPVALLKAVKNEAEIAGFRSAMLKDGIAMVKFLRWLMPAVSTNKETELSVSRRLRAFRAQQPLFRSDSFDTISAYQAHGAIVHYVPTETTDAPLKPEGLLLIDSGAQYLDGTTDITRTIPLGPLTEEQRHVYTLVLKGNIRLAMAKFPDSASGTQIDALAREAMWREGMNYLHGTSHGVGAYLNVHEGPQQIRMEWKPAPLQAGMTITDEPGLYLPQRFGVRIENTMLVTDYRETDFGRFLQLEPLTLCPIDTTAVDRSMLLPEEMEWLNAYHKMVYDRLSPHLSAEENAWLRRATAPL
ncbi:MULTISPECIES: aminopeptidase P family protein [Prevotellaceae]|uniref:aminopeptidase P family protein n=1 Tax=Prevotellaceae TaxID=171552 RepID=UPI0003D356D3|nr:aminopeptidase P family protein [Prevotella phocaeensis]ETD16408.1 hypothetical protein HMPREF1199_02071 [Hoylesella oralis CC98A]